MAQKFTEINKNSARILQEELTTILRKFAADNGMTLEKNGATYDGAGVFGMKIEMHLVDSEKKNAKDEQFSKMLGYSENIVGCNFRAKTSTGMKVPVEWKVIGIEVGRSSFPIKAEQVNNPEKRAYFRAGMPIPGVEYVDPARAFLGR